MVAGGYVHEKSIKKRYIRELKSDFGKYLAIALFMIMLIGLVSGYLVAAGSIEKTFYEGWDKYNVEDGHITFSLEPTAEVMSKIGKEAGATFMICSMPRRTLMTKEQRFEFLEWVTEIKSMVCALWKVTCLRQIMKS